MAGVKIRDAPLDDLPAIVEIYNSTVPSRMVTADPEPVSVEVSVYVSEKHRRRGIGRLLLEEAIRLAPELGLKTLTGGIFGHNVPSIRLFEGLGFERWAHYPKVAELDGVERDLIVLGLRLDGTG